MTHVLPAIRDAITLSRQLDAARPAELAATELVLPFLETTDRLTALMADLDQRLAKLLEDHIQNSEKNGEPLLELRAGIGAALDRLAKPTRPRADSRRHRTGDRHRHRGEGRGGGHRRRSDHVGTR